MGSATLATSSWFCVLAVLAVLGDAFLPFLPSGTLVILAVLKTDRIAGAPLYLAAAVALSSFLGDVLLLALARRGAPSCADGSPSAPNWPPACAEWGSRWRGGPVGPRPSW